MPGRCSSKPWASTLLCTASWRQSQYVTLLLKCPITWKNHWKLTIFNGTTHYFNNLYVKLCIFFIRWTGGSLLHRSWGHELGCGLQSTYRVYVLFQRSASACRMHLISFDSLSHSRLCSTYTSCGWLLLQGVWASEHCPGWLPTLQSHWGEVCHFIHGITLV